jgi:hypothetical protein
LGAAQDRAFEPAACGSIGRRMVVKQQVPHFYVSHDYDMRLMEMRAQINVVARR